MKGINGAGLAVGLVGGVFVYSAITGSSLIGSVKKFLGEGVQDNANAITGTVDSGVVPGSSTGTIGPISPTASGGNATVNQNIGKLLATPYGWGTGPEWDALNQLWTRESGWNNTAKNSSSGAYGIPQALPESKLPALGQESGGSSASAQIAWGLSYIKSRYGSPSAAWAHETANSWY